MPQRERKYRILLDLQPPEDLAARCSAVWRELLDIAEHHRPAGRSRPWPTGTSRHSSANRSTAPDEGTQRTA